MLIGFSAGSVSLLLGNHFSQNKKDIFLSFNMLKKLLSISVFISIVFLLLLTTPFISAFNSASLLFGIPTLYLYIIIMWALFILLMMWITNTKQSHEK